MAGAADCGRPARGRALPLQLSGRPLHPGRRARAPVRGRRLRHRLLERELEHVGGEEDQRRFVAEALRVGRRAFITTPNRWFPVEVHTHLPLVHWLPDNLSDRAYDLARKPWAKQNRLLGPGSFRRLFPGDVRIVNLGLSLVAVVD